MNRRTSSRPEPTSSAVNDQRLQSVLGNLTRPRWIASRTACSGVQRRATRVARPSTNLLAREGALGGQQNRSKRAAAASTLNGFSSTATTPGAVRTESGIRRCPGRQDDGKVGRVGPRPELVEKLLAAHWPHAEIEQHETRSRGRVELAQRVRTGPGHQDAPPRGLDNFGKYFAEVGVIVHHQDCFSTRWRCVHSLSVLRAKRRGRTANMCRVSQAAGTTHSAGSTPRPRRLDVQDPWCAVHAGGGAGLPKR